MPVQRAAVEGISRWLMSLKASMMRRPFSRPGNQSRLSNESFSIGCAPLGGLASCRQAAPRDESGDPLHRAQRALADRRQRHLPVVVVEYLEAVVAAVAHVVQLARDLGHLVAVHAFAGEHA